MSTPDDIRAKISKLTAAIEQHKQINSYSAPRGRGRGRGYSTWMPRGRGRGSAGMRPPTFGNKQLVLNKPASAATAATANSSMASSSLQSSSTTSLKPTTPASHSSRTVVINGVRFVADASGKKLTRQDLVPAASTLVAKMQLPKATPVPSYTPQKAEIEGIEYVRTKGGNLIRAELAKERLLKKAKSVEAKKAAGLQLKHTRAAAQTEERRKKKKVSRSKGGHLVYVKEPDGYVRQGRHGKSLVLQGTQTDKSKMYCGYFTRYGKCKDGKKCPFKHDRSHRAICPRYLQNKCPKPAHLCLLSHCPIPEIMPHCSHFQRGKCDRVNCPYPHVRVSPQASVCKAFALEGYCAKGSNCKNKHIHVCPDFAETGKCQNATCKLPHVALRKKHGPATTKANPAVRQWVNPQLVSAGSKREHDALADEHVSKKIRTERPGGETDVKLGSEAGGEDGFVKFDDYDDEGWSAFQMKDEDFDLNEQLSLHFSDHDESDHDHDESESESEDDVVEGEGEDEGEGEEDVSSDDVSSDEDEA